MVDGAKKVKGFGSSRNNNRNELKEVKRHGEILHAQGVKSQKSGHIDSAERSYTKALNIGYCHPDLLTNLAVIWKNKKKDNDAILLLEKSVSIRENSTAYNLLSAIYQKQGELKTALSAIKRAIQLDSTNYRSYLIEASIYRDMNKSEEAIKSLNKSLSLNCSNSESYLSLGIIYRDTGEYEKALEYTKRSIQLEANNIKAHINLSDILKDTMNDEKAIECLNHALEIDPKNTMIQLRLARLYFRKSEYANVNHILGSTETDKNSISTWKILEAANLFETQQYDKAKAKLLDLKRTDINNEATSEEIGVALKAVEYAINMRNASDTYIRERENEAKSLIQLNREVEQDLMDELETIQLQELSETKDTRYGNGYCTNFSLFKNNSLIINRLYRDLKDIIWSNLGKRPCEFQTDSFLNVFYSGAGQPSHTHIKEKDEMFGLSKHKYSLVYYLEIGDQECNHPGILKLHGPNKDILPTRGMIVIVPATREHSVQYDGRTKRMMIGANFYAF